MVIVQSFSERWFFSVLPTEWTTRDLRRNLPRPAHRHEHSQQPALFQLQRAAGSGAGRDHRVAADAAADSLRGLARCAGHAAAGAAGHRPGLRLCGGLRQFQEPLAQRIVQPAQQSHAAPHHQLQRAAPALHRALGLRGLPADQRHAGGSLRQPRRLALPHAAQDHPAAGHGQPHRRAPS